MIKPKLISFEIGKDKSTNSAAELKELANLHKSGQPVLIDEWLVKGLPVGKRLLERRGIEDSLSLVVEEVRSETEEAPKKFISEEEIRAYINDSQLSDDDKIQFNWSTGHLFNNGFTDREIDEIFKLNNGRWEEKLQQGKWIEGFLGGRNETVEIILKSSGRKVWCERFEMKPPIMQIVFFDGRVGVGEHFSLTKEKKIDDTQKTTGAFNSVEGVNSYLRHCQLNNNGLNKADEAILTNNVSTLFDNNVTREELDDIIRLMGKSWEEKVESGRRMGGPLSGVDNVEIELKSSGRKIICLRYKVDSNPAEEMAFYASGGYKSFYLRHIKP